MSICQVLFGSTLIVAISAIGVQGGIFNSFGDCIFGCVAGNHHQRSYNRINDYLKTYLPESASSTDAVRWARTYASSLRPESLSELDLAAGLSRFQDLERAVAPSLRCSVESIDILRDNAIGSQLKIGSRSEGQRRVERVVTDYLIEHARLCENFYPIKYRNIVAMMDEVLVTRVQDFQDRKASNHRDWLTRDDLNLKRVRFDTERDAKTAIASITRLASDDYRVMYLCRVPDEFSGRAVIDKSRVKQLFDIYLLDPCQYYVEKLNQVFLPYWFDQLSLKDMRAREEWTDFHMGSSRYRLCERLVYNDRKVLLDQMLAYLERSTSI